MNFGKIGGKNWSLKISKKKFLVKLARKKHPQARWKFCHKVKFPRNKSLQAGWNFCHKVKIPRNKSPRNEEVQPVSLLLTGSSKGYLITGFNEVKFASRFLQLLLYSLPSHFPLPWWGAELLTKQWLNRDYIPNSDAYCEFTTTPIANLNELFVTYMQLGIAYRPINILSLWSKCLKITHKPTPDRKPFSSSW